MKKLFLFLSLSVLAVSLNSCSGDDGNDTVNNTGTSTFSMKINGTLETYNTISVSQENLGDGDIYLTITASQGGSPNDIVTFNTYSGETGVQAMYAPTIKYNGITYQNFNIGQGSLNSNIIVNNGSRIQGTLAGTLMRYNEQTQQEETITVTEGSFDIYY